MRRHTICMQLLLLLVSAAVSGALRKGYLQGIDLLLQASALLCWLLSIDCTRVVYVDVLGLSLRDATQHMHSSSSKAGAFQDSSSTRRTSEVSAAVGLQ